MMIILALTTPNQRPEEGCFLHSPLRHAPLSCRFLVKSCSPVEEFTSCFLPREVEVEGFGKIRERGKGESGRPLPMDLGLWKTLAFH